MRFHERNERDRARRRTESREQRLAKRNVRDRARRKECTESAEDKAARAEQMRARRRSESAEHRATRLEQMRVHSGVLILDPVAWVQTIQHSDANWECTKSVNNLKRY